MPLPSSAEDFIATVRSRLERVKFSLHTTRHAKSTLINEPFEPTHYEVLYTMAGLLHERTRLLLMECETQHRLITDNCEVAVQERLTQAKDDELPLEDLRALLG